MGQFVLHKDGTSIKSVDDWFFLAPPKLGERQWKDGRSAKELAKAFFRQGKELQVPEELTALCNSVPELGDVRLKEATPEYKVQLDSFGGETRNTDLACLADSSAGPIAISIEAKALESFGPTVSERLLKVKPRSNVPKRIALLGEALFGEKDRNKLGDLRYQLLHSVAASLIYAEEKDCHSAFFVIYEFISKKCEPRNLDSNARDLNRFLEVLSGGTTASLPTGILLGPFRVPGGEYIPVHIPLYIGKVSQSVEPEQPSQ